MTLESKFNKKNNKYKYFNHYSEVNA